METNRSQESRDRQRQRRTQNARDRRQRMTTEQKQQHLEKRRTNYRQAKDKGKQVQTTTAANVDPVMPFHDLSNTNFTSTRYYGNHDHEAGPSTIHTNHMTFG
ncbi:unnamed protein product [Trifolium pratense]|uniref:Uncharacterized protein n=1 Tax=Trifolium pratense TaxID=57577 RepID=A0ACB0K8Q0_TRIPR|nr:unnamed protein product [Trifolium pratense]